MKRITALLSIILLLFSLEIKAQGDAAIPMLGLNPNPQSFGMGMSGVSLPSNDPLGFYFNPAMLGYSSQRNNLALQFYTDKTRWLPGIVLGGTAFNNLGISAGYNFGDILGGLKLSAGIGFISSKLDYGFWGYYDQYGKLINYFNSYDQYYDYGIGVSFNYFVNLSLGVTIKRIDSRLSPLPNGEAFINAMDWGVLMNVPISKLAAEDLLCAPFKNTSLKPIVNLSMGYSRSNSGKEIFYVDEGQKSPLPLTARLGYTLSLGTDLLVKSKAINFFTYDMAIEAEDLLVNIDNAKQVSYQGLLGNIKPWENLLEWRRTAKVVLRKGQKLSLFETVSFMNGSFYNSTLYNNWTNGIIVSTSGIFKLLSWNYNDNQYVKFFLDHFEIQYVKASWFYNSPEVETKVEALSVSFLRFTF
jgi:hypothetical protein